MSRKPARSRTARRRTSFTLVELLVTVTILGILAGMMLGALAVTRAAAREAATRATIAKLHNIITEKYESYRTRRVPMSDEDIYRVAAAGGYTGGMPVPGPLAALIRLRALRDIMRMEMPERWTDITNGAQYMLRWNAVNSVLVPNPPGIYLAYQSRYLSRPPAAAHAPAKCLYLFVTMAGGEDARRQFRDSEIATDSDGYSMFVDGWGHPIYFLRWAPGFIDSEIQWNCMSRTEFAAGQTWSDAATVAQQVQAATDDHDPFDSRRVSAGWRLVPLIYSAGPDGEYGINIDAAGATAYAWADDHYAQGWGLPTRTPTGIPLNTDFDNIHNHRNEMEAR